MTAVPTPQIIATTPSTIPQAPFACPFVQRPTEDQPGMIKHDIGQAIGSEVMSTHRRLVRCQRHGPQLDRRRQQVSYPWGGAANTHLHRLTVRDWLFWARKTVLVAKCTIVGSLSRLEGRLAPRGATTAPENRCHMAKMPCQVAGSGHAAAL